MLGTAFMIKIVVFGEACVFLIERRRFWHSGAIRFECEISTTWAIWLRMQFMVDSEGD